MLMVLVAGVLVILAISVSSPPRIACHYHQPSAEGDDAQLHRLCQMIRHDDPDWWARHCKI